MRGLNLKLTLSLIDKMTAPARKLQQRFAEAFSRMSQNLIAFGRNLEKVGKKMSQAGQWATMRITAPILGLGAASIRTAGQNEQLAISLEGIAGSAAEAEAYLQKLMKWGEKSPFDVADIVDAELALRNAGYGMDDAAERRRMLGEIAAGSKKSLMEVTSAYLDMRKAGKVGSSELHEMMKANIPVIKELSKMLGVSDQRIYQLAEDGKISFQQVRDAMRRMTAEGGVMHGKMQRYGRSIFGVFKDLGRSLSESLAGVGRDLYDNLEIADKIERLTATIRSLAEGFMKLPKPVKDFIVWTALIAAILGPVLLIVGQITVGIALFSIGIGKLIPIIGLAAKAFTGFFTVLLASPLGWIATACLAAGVAGVLLVRNWSKVSAFFSGMWAQVKADFKTAIDFIMPYIDQLMGMVDKIVGAFGRLKNLAADNPVTRGWNLMFGDEPAAPNPRLTNAPKAPIGGMGATQQVDAGGVIHVKIDGDGKPRVVDARPNDRRMKYQADTGLLMGGY